MDDYDLGNSVSTGGMPTWIGAKAYSSSMSLSNERVDVTLLRSIKVRLPELEKLLDEVSGHWGYEDEIYRFYHHSLKVFYIQEMTSRITDTMESLMPNLGLCDLYQEIFKAGTGEVFDIHMNKEWSKHTRPLVEAFMHARHHLEMIVKYGKELDKAPDILPSGW